jgi:nucleoside phosphorylase
MILILGSSHDDVLYFESIMNNKREDKIYDRYPVIYGTIYNQDVALVSEIYTSYVANAVTLHMMEKYFIILVFCVGTCVAYSDDWKLGDIAVSKELVLGDVDQSAVKPVRLGQIPDFPARLGTPRDVSSFLMPAIDSRNILNYHTANYVSSNSFFTNYSELEHLLVNGRLCAFDDHIVLDCTSGGVALACALKNVPFACLKVVERNLGELVDFESYAKVLEVFADVGKAVISAIGSIGRNDVLEEN